MPQIQLVTHIAAPLQVVFDLSRSIDLHQQSMRHTNEKVINGKAGGLVQYGESVTWQAKHLFRNRRLTVKITQMQPYSFFEDQMTEGDFKSMRHAHYFSFDNRETTMKDIFSFEAPFGLAGRLFSQLFLTNYMRSLLIARNIVIKDYAESGRWTSVLR